MSVSTDEKKIDELLSRGVEEIIDREHLKKKLMSGKKLRVKFGIDPTGTDLHIGHAVPLRKLRQFQDLGHTVVLLIGDYTAMIGDPTGRNETRPILSEEHVKDNMKTYVKQAAKVLNIKKTEIRRNSEWYKKNYLALLMELAGHITVTRILERDDFQKRLKAGQDIRMQETFYPLLQGYDSVMLKADVEIGGTDQKFNLLMGRKLQKKYDQEEQDVLMLPLLVGTDGEKKMSKSYGNYIALNDIPEEMYGKVMSIPDSMILFYFKLATDVPMTDIQDYATALDGGANPRDIKMKLAYAITRLYYGDKGAKRGEEHFAMVIQQHERPSQFPTLRPTASDIVTVLVEAGFVKSRGEARRDIEGGGVRVNDKKITMFDAQVASGDIVQKGKRFFIKIA